MKLFKGLICLILVLCLLPGCRTQTRETLLQKGVELAQTGDYDGAIVCFRSALERDANYSEARYELARAYLRTGRFERAENEFQKVLRQDGSYPGLPLELAELNLNTSRTEQALELIEGWLSAHGENSEAFDLKGRVHIARNDFPSAERSFLKAISLQPDHISARINLSALYLEEERTEEGMTILKKLLEEAPENVRARYLLAGVEIDAGRWESALEQFRRLADIDMSNPRALYMSGLLHLQRGDRDEARKVSSILDQRFPDHYFPPLLRGLVLYRDENYKEASIAFQAANRIRSDLTAFYFLGLSYYHLGNFELALTEMQRILDYRPASVQARLLSATILLQQKRTTDAIREAEIALTHDPQNGTAHNVIGSAYLAQGKYDLAMTHLSRATALDPNLADAHLKKGIFNLAKGNFGLGEKEVVQAMNIAPEVLDTRLILATHHLRQQNFPAALATLQEGLQGRPQDAILYNMMAGAYFSMNQPKEAVKALEDARRADPRYLTPAFNLASYFITVGEKEKAAAEYRTILQREPANVRALVAAGQLAESKKNESEALAFYRRAKETGTLEGFLALAHYQLKTGKEGEVLSLLDEGLRRHRNSPPLLDLRGKLLLRNGRTAEALAVYRELEKASPGRGYPVVVQIHLQNKERDKAEETARQAIRDNPDRSYGYVLQAGIHESFGERQQALKVLEEARRRVKDPQLEMQIGQIHERDGNRSRAEESYRRLLEKSPRFHPAIFALGSLQDRAGNKREALKLYQQVLQIDNNFTPALNNLAYLHAENYGDPEEGLKLAFQAFRNEPEQPVIMDTLGYLLLRNGRAQEAIPLLERAAGLLPESPTVLYHLGLAYKEAGEKEMAREALQRSLGLGDFPEARKSRTLLAQWE
jgi:putative PEP-CTERM system TPR-repeat lipoprotein